MTPLQLSSEPLSVEPYRTPLAPGLPSTASQHPSPEPSAISTQQLPAVDRVEAEPPQTMTLRLMSFRADPGGREGGGEDSSESFLTGGRGMHGFEVLQEDKKHCVGKTALISDVALFFFLSLGQRKLHHDASKHMKIQLGL